MDESHAVLLARVDENVEHLRADFERFRDEMPELVKRVSRLERHRSWLVGVGSAIAALLARKEIIVLLGFLLLGCVQAPLVKSPIVMRTRPVRVLIDQRLPICEISSAMFAVDFWQSEGIAMQMDVWDPDQMARRGDVSFVNMDIPGRDILGLTVTIELTVEPGKPEVWAAVVYLDSCLNQVATHELGHALGLKHRSTKGALMYPNEKDGGWNLTAQELGWLR